MEDLATNIIEWIRLHKELFCSFEHVYLFGSVLKEDRKPNDIDILIIYKHYSAQIGEKVKEIHEQMEQEYDLPVDISVLSVTEEIETGFLERIVPYLEI